MPLLSGNVACTRFNVISMPDELNFEQEAFHLIQPGSAIKDRIGFVPFELEESYELRPKTWAFRVRRDKVTVDSTLLKERVKELIKIENEQTGPPSFSKKKELRQLAEDELLARTAPRSSIVECLIEHGVVYVGSTAKASTDAVSELLRRIGVELEYKTPWLELGQEAESSIVEAKDPGQSVLGCHFLKKLLEQSDVLVEPVKGRAKLITSEGTHVSLAGSVINEMNRYLDEGAELISAKLIVKEATLQFDGLSYHFSGLKVENAKADHWTETLETRMDSIRAMWEMLDERYLQAMNTASPQEDS
ncbi:MAG: hypothetical protein CSA81_01815 [Acidobacteria bacterium]|nr:MAG: hypothetical protein CSA81_01815 [Acidobacteriota bacterium]